MWLISSDTLITVPSAWPTTITNSLTHIQEINDAVVDIGSNYIQIHIVLQS